MDFLIAAFSLVVHFYLGSIAARRVFTRQLGNHPRRSDGVFELRPDFSHSSLAYDSARRWATATALFWPIALILAGFHKVTDITPLEKEMMAKIELREQEKAVEKFNPALTANGHLRPGYGMRFPEDEPALIGEVE